MYTEYRLGNLVIIHEYRALRRCDNIEVDYRVINSTSDNNSINK
jgi:hypothetical protein